MIENPIAFEDDTLRVELSHSSEQIKITLEDKISGKRWKPAPLLRLLFHNKMYQRVDTAEHYKTQLLESTENGARLVVTLGGICKLSLGLWMRLVGGELVVHLHLAELYEENPALYRWAVIDLFPGLMRVGADGELLLPITTGVRCHPRGKPALRDRFLIYGEQERVELLPLLPFCAAAESDGGLMALATRAAADSACYVATDGQDNGEIGLGFSFRRRWPDPLDFQTREIRIIPIPRDERTDLFVARRLRRHVMEDLGKSTLHQRAAESAEVAYALSAYTMKAFFGIQNETGFMRQVISPGDLGSGTNLDIMMTFDGCKDALQRLHRAGIDKIETEMTGWSPRGHDGLYPTRLPPDERFGGETGFRDLLRFGQDLGYHTSVHDNYVDGYKVSPDWNANHAIHDIYGEPLVMGLWGGGITYKLWPLALPKERLEDQMRQVQKLGVSGVYYLDAMGNPLEVNYHPKHGGSRSGNAEGVQRVLQSACKIFGAAATECGYLYAVVFADCIATIDWNGKPEWKKNFNPQWPVTALCDRQLPIWQLALHDSVMLEGHGLTWPDVMTKVLFGLHPRTEWCLRPGTYIPPLDDVMIAALKADYDLTIGRFGYLQTLQMTNYEELEDGVVISSFEDGTKVVVNFNTEELYVNNERVGRPQNLMPNE